jgi:hypothetical protein
MIEAITYIPATTIECTPLPLHITEMIPVDTLRVVFTVTPSQLTLNIAGKFGGAGTKISLGAVIIASPSNRSSNRSAPRSYTIDSGQPAIV